MTNDEAILTLRRKLVDAAERKLNEGSSRQLIRTLRGQGYMLQE